MFSCFCANKKKKLSHRGSLKQSTNIMSFNDKKLTKDEKQADPSLTLDTPKIIDKKSLQNNYQLQISNQTTNKDNPIKKITSIQESQNESSSLNDSSVLQDNDSQTIPFKSKEQVSERSTPNMKKHRQGNKRSRESKQSSLIRNMNKTNSQNIQPLFFPLEVELQSTNSKHLSQSLNRTGSKNGFTSIDYSKYSERDKETPSEQILQLNQEMESCLDQLDKLPFDQAQRKVSQTNLLSSGKNLQSQLKGSSRFLKIKKYQDIQNDFNQLEQTQRSISQNIQRKSSLLVKTPSERLARMTRSTIREETNKSQEQRLWTIKQLVQKTVMSELAVIDQDNQGLFFSNRGHIAQPGHITLYKKQINEELQTNEMFQQTLDEAENSFYCDSINDEFTRAVVTRNFGLAERVFQKMTYYEKNQADLKGYHPVHLVILQAIVDDRAFQLSKKLIYNPDIRLDVKGPTGWSPLQQTVSYKHIRLTPNIFISTHRKKLTKIQQTLQSTSACLSQFKDFQFQLQVKVDSFIPLLNNLTPRDTITITKVGKKLLIDYTLVGYEYLSCKRRDMGFLIDCQNGKIFALNRSKQIYCELLEQLDKQEIQLLVVEMLQTQTKKMQPVINKVDVRQARTMFDNQIVDKINQYKSKKFNFILYYTSLTQKRMPQKLNTPNDQKRESPCPLSFLESWQNYVCREHKVMIKPKNKNKKIQLQMWLSQQFNFQVQKLVKIFQLFALCNPLARIISQFLTTNLGKLDIFKNSMGLGKLIYKSIKTLEKFLGNSFRTLPKVSKNELLLSVHSLECQLKLIKTMMCIFFGTIQSQNLQNYNYQGYQTSLIEIGICGYLVRIVNITNYQKTYKV